MSHLVAKDMGNLRIIQQVIDLTSILDRAPSEVVQSIHANGFDLENEVIKINYVLADFDLNHVVTLWFMRTHPIVAIKGAYFRTEQGEEGLYCCDVALIDQLDSFRTAHIQRGETLPFIAVGKEEWFENANELLLQAGRKYDLKQRIADYTDQMYPHQKPPYADLQKSLVEGVVQRVF